ncbi:MAG TPA: Do family serine endopeptidase [Acidisarcina sp.]
MRITTNSLIARTKRLAAPAIVGAALIFAATLVINHNPVHAAGTGAAPLEDNSISSLVALDNAVETVAAHVTPAVVNVAVTSRETAARFREEQQEEGMQGGMDGGTPGGLPPGFSQFFGPGRQQQGPQIEHGIGSGVIISPDGYIVTNDHVVDGAVQIRVTLHDRRVLTAKLVGADKLTDLAVIKIDAKDLPSINWGDSTKLKPGQTVLAFGSPFGFFQFSVTRGIISAVDRPNPYADDARKPGGYIQTDAAINRGNSGGPLVNAHGELIGINTFIISGNGSFAGAGFAIPAQLARATTDQIIKTGSVHHGYLGIGINDVTPENASFFHVETASGAVVSQVTADSPASRAGLKSGDVIDEVDGKKVVNGGALQVAVSEVAPGTTVALGIIRDGKPQKLSVKVGEYHSDKEEASNDGPEANHGGKLGLAVDDLTSDVRQQLGIPAEVHGVAVESVRPASPAEDAGLTPGDVILEVDRKPVQSAEAFVGDVRANPAGKDLLLLVWSRGNASYRVVHPSEGNQNGM